MSIGFVIGGAMTFVVLVAIYGWSAETHGNSLYLTSAMGGFVAAMTLSFLGFFTFFLLLTLIVVLGSVILALTVLSNQFGVEVVPQEYKACIQLTEIYSSIPKLEIMPHHSSTLSLLKLLMCLLYKMPL
jgi:hypothetical protein